MGGAVLNAVAFINGNYLARFLSGNDPDAAQKEKVRHNKALEAYNKAYANIKKTEPNFSIGSQQMIG